MDINSLVVQGSNWKGNPYQSVVPPLSLSTTFVQKNLHEFQEFEYTRGNNPTRNELENLAKKLEKAQFGFAFSSGMAATTTVFNLLEKGDKVLINSNVYGGTYRYLEHLFPKQGLEYEVIDDLNELTGADFTENVKIIFLETPSNPLLRVVDIEKIAKLAHAHGALLVVDNTFLTAYLQRPLDLGADIVIYSATKYLGGHSDVLAGLVLTNHKEIGAELQTLQMTLGNVLAPFDAYALIKGIKTLSVRLDRQVSNTLAVIDFFKGYGIKEVNYPGSFSTTENQIQANQARGIGAVISIVLPEEHDLDKFIEALNLFPLAVSLGGVESLICLPATMTHDSFGEELLKKAGISPRLLRLAIGIEKDTDLIADLKQALDCSKVV